MTTILVAALSLLGSGLAALLSYRASTAANKVSEKKVDAEAYERSQQFYEKLLGEADKALDRLRGQVERLQDQLDRVNGQLAQEQDVSNLLRNHVRSLQTQVNGMETAVSALRTQITNTGSATGTRRPPPPADGLPIESV
jgi:chromosome segregation ATPase